MKRLPAKFSDLINVAVNDMKKIVKNPKYRIELDFWHVNFTFFSHEQCSVCFAGTVMAGTLKCPITDVVEPTDFDDITCRKLKALDELRTGSPARAVGVFYDDFSKRLGRAPIVNFVRGDDLQNIQIRARFYRQMRAVSKWLAKQGL